MIFSREAYLQRLEELYRISPSVQNVGFAPEAYKPGLEGMRALDSALGSPSSRLRCVHVAGTNGKGSVCCMIAASLAASGLRVGLYTSPHLLDFRERIKIISGDLPGCGGPDRATLGTVRGRYPLADGVGEADVRDSIARKSGRFEDTECGFEMIPEEEVYGFLEGKRAILEGRSFFEVTTAMAFWWFDRQQVDIAVIEVGLGGLLDSTNIIVPEISIVTSIGLDHCAILGGTRAEIAAQKAGIFKPGTPALVWGHDDQTDPVFEKVASEAACPLFYADEPGEKENPNAGTVRTALEILGFEPDEDAIADFRSICGLRGRWDRVNQDPETICDIGHNPAALKLNYDRLVKTGRKLILVYGVMADKDYRTNIGLIPENTECFLAAPSIPRALPADKLGEAFSEFRPDLKVTVCGSVADAVEKSQAAARKSDNSIVYICGSTFVVAEAMTLF